MTARCPVHSYDNFTRLEEVWLGDVYPEDFYHDLEPTVRDTFRIITQWTKEDLEIIQATLTSLGVKVRRPIYDQDRDAYCRYGTLVKPEICPRDQYNVVGQRLIVNDWYLEHHWTQETWPWRHVVSGYQQQEASICSNNTSFVISGSQTVRFGRDFYVDCVFSNQYRNFTDVQAREHFDREVVPMFPDLRCHYINNGGHIDGCFALLKPGWLLTTRYFDSYDQFFPGWQHISLSNPEFSQSARSSNQFTHNGQWHVPGLNLTTGFNDYVLQFAPDWVGNYVETFFDVNCLIVDPESILMLGHNAAVIKQLETIGFNVHSVPFRCRTFWDGGLHCITLDIRRQGTCIDYFK